MKVAQWCPTLCDPIYYTVHGILQARILEWVAFPLSRGFSLTRDRTQVSHNAGRFFTSWPTRKALSSLTLELIWVCHIMLMHSFQSQFCHSSFFFFFLDLYWFYKSQHKSTFSQVSSYPPPPLSSHPLLSPWPLLRKNRHQETTSVLSWAYHAPKLKFVEMLLVLPAHVL